MLSVDVVVLCGYKLQGHESDVSSCTVAFEQRVLVSL